MKKIRTFFLVTALSAALAPMASMAQTTQATTTVSVTQETRQERAVAALNLYRGGDQAALAWFHPSYTEHDLAIPDGVDGLREYAQTASGVENLVVHRVLQDGNYVVLHSSDGRVASFDVFLFEGDLIVERWQNAEALGAPNPSGRTLVGGTTEISGRGTTDLEANKMILRTIGRIFADGGPYEALRPYYDENFIQHSSYMGDGLDALLALVAEPAPGPKSVSINHLLLAEGDFVFSASEDRGADGTTAYFDFFRIENGRIVEHWDTVQQVPPRSEWQNNNGKF